MVRTRSILARRGLVALAGFLVSGCSILHDHGVAHETAHVPSAPPVQVDPAERNSSLLTEFSHKLAAAEEERKALVLRGQQLEALLEERDRTIQQATLEIQATSAEVTRTRAELQQGKQEMATLRDRLANSEKENAATLQSMIALMEKMVERGKQTTAAPEKGAD